MAIEIESDVLFLERVRELIGEILPLGYAPAGREGKASFREWRSDAANEALVRDFVQATSRLENLLDAAKVGYIAVQPQPGGLPNITGSLFSCVTDNFSLRNMDKSMFLDPIDKAIGFHSRPSESKPARASEAPTSPPAQPGSIFVVMPMDPEHPELVDVLDAIKRAATEADMTAERIDDPQSDEAISPRILEAIETAERIVVDLTHERPNVYYEAGYAHGVGKIPTYVASEETKVHFDVGDYPVIFFENLASLREKLAERLKGGSG